MIIQGQIHFEVGSKKRQVTGYYFLIFAQVCMKSTTLYIHGTAIVVQQDVYTVSITEFTCMARSNHMTILKIGINCRDLESS